MSAPREKGPFHQWVYFTITGGIAKINHKMREKYPHAEVVSAAKHWTDSRSQVSFIVLCRAPDGSKVPEGFEDHV